MGSLPNNAVLKGEVRSRKPKLLHRAFEEVARGSAGPKKALIFEDDKGLHTVTYSDLDAISTRLSSALRSLFKSPRDYDEDRCVAVRMRPSAKLPCALLAAWKAGCAYLPIDARLPAERVSMVLQEAQPEVVVHDGDFTYDGATRCVSYDELLKMAEGLPKTQSDDKNNLAIILYTSGSTGIPKGVRLPHAVVQNRLEWQFERFPYAPTEEFCVFKTALTFVDSVSEIWGPLLNGRTILVVDKETTQDPEKLVKLLDDYKIERLVLVPTLLRSILLYLQMQKEKSLLKNLKIWVSSGEALAVSLAEEFFQYFSNGGHVLCNFYGSTEVMGDVTYHVMSGAEELKGLDKIPIGKPVHNTVVHLMDATGRPLVLSPGAQVETQSAGEMWVSGANVAAGYVKGRDPERLSREAQVFRTGDFAKICDGVLVYEGRTDSQVKIRGHRVDLSELERAALSLPSVERTIALVYRPGAPDQQVLVCVTLRPGWRATATQLEGGLGRLLPEYARPRVVLLPEGEGMPLLVNGKIDRQELLRRFREMEEEDCMVAPAVDVNGVPEDRRAAARALLETVASVLGRSARAAATLDANFYEIGGNSLNSIVTITKLKELGYSIRIADFLKSENLGNVLDTMTSDKQAETEDKPEEFVSEELQEHHKEHVIRMITSSFYQKADLEQWLTPEIRQEDYPELLELIWDDLVSKGLSFIVRDPRGRYVGTSLNFDARDEPQVHVASKLMVIFEFLEFLEGPVRDTRLPEGTGKLLHNFMMGTNEKLNAQDNIAVMQFMESEEIRLGRNKKFEYVYTTNTSPLTQQLDVDVFGYETYTDYQVNKYVAADGTKPFGEAPDAQRAIVSVKKI